MGSEITAARSGIASPGIGSPDFLRDQSVPFLVGSGTKISHAFEFKDQKFGRKNGISDEKTTLL